MLPWLYQEIVFPDNLFQASVISLFFISPFVKVSCIERLKFFLTLVNVFPRIKDKTRKNIN